jgi:hypothetical protein
MSTSTQLKLYPSKGRGKHGEWAWGAATVDGVRVGGLGRGWSGGDHRPDAVWDALSAVNISPFCLRLPPAPNYVITPASNCVMSRSAYWKMTRRAAEYNQNTHARNAFPKCAGRRSPFSECITFTLKRDAKLRQGRMRSKYYNILREA